MKTILVVGGTGLIGSSIVNRLLINKFKVNILSRSKVSSKDERIKYFNYHNVREGFENVSHVVFALGSAKPFNMNVTEYLDEIQAVENLLELCSEFNIAKLIVISSGGAIYGNVKTGAAKESDKLNPVSFYGYHKIVIEKLIQKSLVPFSILRLSNPYGFSFREHLTHGLINVAINKAINDETITIFGDGENIKDYIYVEDFLDALQSVINTEENDMILNIGSGYSCSTNDILRKIEIITNIKLKIKYIDKNINDIKRVCLDITAAEKKLAWKPQVSIEQGLKLSYQKLISKEEL